MSRCEWEREVSEVVFQFEKGILTLEEYNCHISKLLLKRPLTEKELVIQSGRF